MAPARSFGRFTWGLAVTMLLASWMLPAVGTADPAGSPLVIGVNTTGTLSATPTAGYYVADYAVDLAAGQTLCATYTPSLVTSQPAMAMWAPFASDVGTLTRNVDSNLSSWPAAMCMLAPRAATYRVRLMGRTAGATYTIDTTLTVPRTFTLAPLVARKFAVRDARFKVATVLSGTFDQLENPLTFVLQREIRHHWRPFSVIKSVSDFRGVGATDTVPFHAYLRLPLGRFRMRAEFADSAHPTAQHTAWKIVTIDTGWTKLPRGMGPRTALRTYMWDVGHGRYRAAFALLPRDKQRSYGSATAYAEQVRSYGLGKYRMGPSRTKGSEVTIVARQDTPAMAITYTWTYARVGSSWFVKSRVMGGKL